MHSGVYEEVPSLLSKNGICLIVKDRIFMETRRFGMSDLYSDVWKKKGVFHKALFALQSVNKYNRHSRTRNYALKSRYPTQLFELEVLQKKNNKEIFIAHNDELLSWEPALVKSYLDNILDNFFEETNKNIDGNPRFGILCKLEKFQGIKLLEIEFKENQNQTEIKQSDRHILGDLFKKIDTIDTDDLKEYEFEEGANRLCVIQYRSSRGIDIISKPTTIELTEYARVFLIELDGKEIVKDYLEIYFHNEIGKIYREKIRTLRELRNIPIYLPNKTTQRKRIKFGFKVIDKIDELKGVLNSFVAEFASSPSKSEEIIETIEAMIEETRVLTKTEEIQRLIDAQMETKVTEFKDGYHFNYKVPEDIAKRNKLIEEEKMRSLDEINAFLNTDGGHLIFGVLDEKNTKSKKFEVIGISKDLKKYKSNDELKTSIINSMRDNFREVVADYINFHFIKLENKDLLVIEIESYRARNQNYVFWKDQNKQVKYRSSSSSLDLPIPEMDTFKMSGKIEDR